MTVRYFMARSAEKSVTGADAGTTGGTRLLRATVAIRRIKRNVSTASLKETDEADRLIGKPNLPRPTSPGDIVFAPFNRAIAHLQAHAATTPRSRTSYRPGRQHCQPNRQGASQRWDRA